MGKSPGKWMKTLIFGKKSSRTKQKRWEEDGKQVSLFLDQIGSTNVSLNVCEMSDHKIQENIQHDHSLDETGTQVPANQTLFITKPIEAKTLNDSDRIREQSAIHLQAAFRGYLARRQFWSLKGIIRLQALIRGHLVRRQAISTLHCMFQVVKFQALARGIKIRQSMNLGVVVKKRCTQVNNRVTSTGEVNTSMGKLKLLANGFARKVANLSPTATPLHFHYNSDETNSVLSWLERWSAARCWLLLPKPKAAQSSKFQKPDTRRSPVTIKSVETIAYEFDKPIRNLRKASSNESANFTEENPEIVLERVKQNLRKVDGPVLQITVYRETEPERIHTYDNTQKMTPDPEKLSVSKTETVVEPESEKEDKIVNERKKLKRGASVRANQLEPGKNNEPLQIKKSVPSYMATTVSAKAKLKSQDGLVETPSTLSHRHSLPSLGNTKVSPRMMLQTTGKHKNDRSLQLSRHGSVKVINQVEWRL